MKINRPRTIRAPVHDGAGVGGQVKETDSPSHLAAFLSDYRRPGWLDRPSWERVSTSLRLIAMEVRDVSAHQTAHLYYEAARILETELNDDEGAVKALQAAYALNPEYRPVIRMARRVFTRIERWSMVCTFVEAWARSAYSEDERSCALVELGEILLMRFGKVDDAVRCVQRGAQSEGEGSYGRLVYETIRSLQPHEERGEALFESGIMDGPLGECVMLLRCLPWLTACRSRELAPHLAEGMALSHGRPVFAACLTSVFSASGFRVEYHQLSKNEALTLPEVGLRAARLYSLAMCAEQDGSGRRVVSDYIQAGLQCGAELPDLFVLRGRLAAADGDWKQASSHYEEAWRTSSDTACRQYALEQALLTGCQTFANLNAIERLSTGLLALVPASPLARWAAICTLVRREKWDSLVDVVTDERDALDRVGLKSELAWRLGSILEHRLSRVHEARLAYEDVAELHPNSVAGPVSLVALLHRQDGLKAAEIAFDRARPLLEARGIDGVEGCLSLSDWWAQWLTGGGAELTPAPFPIGADPIVGGLDPVYIDGWQRAPGRFADLLRARAGAACEPALRSALYRWSAQVVALDHEKKETGLPGIELALTCLGEAPVNLRVGVELAILNGAVEQAADWSNRFSRVCKNDLIAGEYLSLAGTLMATTDRLAGEQLHLRALERYPQCASSQAFINKRLLDDDLPYEHRLSLATSMIQGAKQAGPRAFLTLISGELARLAGQPAAHVFGLIPDVPGHEVRLLDLMARLRLAFHFQDDRTAGELLGQIGEARLMGDGSPAFLCASARFLEMSGDGLGAFTAINQAFRADKTPPEGVRWLWQWLAETADVDVLSERLEGLLAYTYDDAERAWLWAEAARMLRLAEQKNQAIKCYEASLRLAPSGWLPLYHLRCLRDEMGLPEMAADLGGRLAGALTAAEAVLLVSKDAAERFLALGKDVDALKMCLVALESSPSDQEAFDRARRLAEKLVDWMSWSKALRTRLGDVPEEQPELLIEYAQLLVSRLHRVDEAIGILESAIERGTTESVVRLCADLLVEQSDWARAAHHYEFLHLSTSNVQLSRALAFRLVAIYIGHLRDDAEARRLLNSLIEFEPTDVDALVTLADLENGAGNQHVERILLARAISVAADDDRKAALRIRLARLDQSEDFDDLAARRLRSAAADAVASPDIQESLADAFAAQNALIEQRIALETAIELTSRPEDLRRLEAKLKKTTPVADLGDGPIQAKSLAALKNLAMMDPLDVQALSRYRASLDSQDTVYTAQVDCFRRVVVGLTEPTPYPIDAPCDTPWTMACLVTLRSLPSPAIICAVAHIIDALPTMYRHCPTPYMPTRDIDATTEALRIAALPIWVSFDMEARLVVSRQVMDQPADRLTFLIALAEEYQRLGVNFLSCWSSVGVTAIIRAVARSLGNDSMGPESLEEANLRAAMTRVFAIEPPTEALVAALSLAVEHLSLLEELLNEVHRRVWRCAILRCGQLEIGLRLLKLWSETASENLQKQYKAILAHMGQQILSGTLASFASDPTHKETVTNHE